MKKNKLLLFSSLLLSTPICAMEDLPTLMNRDVILRPYVKDLIASSDLPEQARILENMESTITFRQLNFKELIRGVFKDQAWVPHVHDFRNGALRDLFHSFAPKLAPSEVHMIFLANVLYDAGSRIYKQFADFSHLEHSASIGHADAQRTMFSVDFKAGKLTEAVNYLFCSAAQGNPDALLTLSEVYQGYWGLGIERDLNIAKLLCQEASALGNMEAQFRIEVATLTEGMFNAERNYQQGVRTAKQLADSGNKRAKEFIEGILVSSGDALQEGNDSISYEDLDFLRQHLGWKDSEDE